MVKYQPFELVKNYDERMEFSLMVKNIINEKREAMAKVVWEIRADVSIV